jgi:signal transduction histidine kinase/ActR/RegA family two-component response regulator
MLEFGGLPSPLRPSSLPCMSAASVFQSLFDRSPVGECLLSPGDDPVILAVNDSFLRLSGRTRESLVGQPLFAAFPGNPDDTGDTGVAALRASLARTIASGQPDALPLQRYPIRVQQPGGGTLFEERFWRVSNTPIFDSAGTLVCVAHRTEDVTGQWRVEDALRRSTERQLFQLSLSDQLRGLTSPDEIARTAARMLGEKLRIARVTYVEVDESSGTFVQRHWSHAQPDLPSERRLLQDFGAEIIDTLRRGKPLVICDVLTDSRTRAHARAYADIGVRSNLAIPLVKSGRLSIVLSLQHDAPRDWSETDIELASDVAERTWLAAENARAQEELREASRRKDEFLAMLAHELRNPLAPLNAAAELLTRYRLDEARLHNTGEVIARQVRHMTGLVDDLLDVSRVTRGLVVINETPQDIQAVVAAAVEQAWPLIEAQQHRLSIDAPPQPAIVSGDAKRLVQIVSNLLHNAAKYTPSNGHIQVSVEMDREQVRIRVRDNGIGIPKEEQPRIFQLFAQAQRGPDRSQGGLGLGLALVKSLVELHRGSVMCFSEGVDQGSCFTVTLPRMEPPAVTATPVTPRDTRIATRGLDVLVVDDNADAAEMLKLLLEAAGHRVRVEYDPAGALAQAAAHAPDAGLIDIGLPGMDGYELVRRFRSTGATAGAIYVALTGYGQEADRTRALAAGFDEHLVKPADPERLLSLLDRFLPQAATRSVEASKD